jgi:ABC-2 type transport system ATP-binding protein
MSVIATAGLTRRFGNLTAVSDLTFTLEAGGVIGLVGPNGSGKSTLIRMLLGLIRPSAGSAEVLGSPISSPGRFSSRVGALIENPAFVPALSARGNLLSLSRLRELPDRRVDEVLDVVGLIGRDREPVGRYSLGMKQRLGIAAALLPNPDLLILDEPTNGLDPAGIVEIRQLLGTLASEGGTVIVASHLLGEIQAACDRLVVIRFGELLFNGQMDELLDQAGEHIEVAPEHPGDVDQLRRLIEDGGWITDTADDVVRVRAPTSASAAVNRSATAGGITLRLLSGRQETLEDVFLRITGGSDDELADSQAAQAGGGRHRRPDRSARSAPRGEG